VRIFFLRNVSLSVFLACQVRGGVLYVNGVAQDEPFIAEAPAYVLNKLTVPPGDVSSWLQFLKHAIGEFSCTCGYLLVGPAESVRGSLPLASAAMVSQMPGGYHQPCLGF
jgi:hypothetical protein